MEMIVHYPKDKQNLNALQEKIAIQHGEFLYSYLIKLEMDLESKIAIMDGVKSLLK